jgi:hypothetical protein
MLIALYFKLLLKDFKIQEKNLFKKNVCLRQEKAKDVRAPINQVYVA